MGFLGALIVLELVEIQCLQFRNLDLHARLHLQLITRLRLFKSGPYTRGRLLRLPMLRISHLLIFLSGGDFSKDAVLLKLSGTFDLFCSRITHLFFYFKLLIFALFWELAFV